MEIHLSVVGAGGGGETTQYKLISPFLRYISKYLGDICRFKFENHFFLINYNNSIRLGFYIIIICMLHAAA